MDRLYGYLNETYFIPTSKHETQLSESVATLTHLEKCVKDSEWTNAKELIELVYTVGNSLLCQSSEKTVVHNTLLRFLKLIREEAIKLTPNGYKELQLNLLSNTYSVDWSLIGRDNLCKQLLTASDDFKADMKSYASYISNLSLNFIHSDELILTVGHSKTVYSFLKYAANKNRRFRVIVCEAFPNKKGYNMAESLAADEISVTLVPDNHVFGLMARVNKVILGCDTVYPDGSMKAQTGTYGVMLAAKHFSIPTYVCLPSYKISPVNFNMASNCSFSAANTHAKCTPGNLTDSLAAVDLSVNWLDAPSKLLPDSEKHKSHAPAPVVWMPNWDFIPPGLASLFLTIEGGQAPSYLYAMVRELFHPDDIDESVKWIQA